jgi:hypothetical protein
MSSIVAPTGVWIGSYTFGFDIPNPGIVAEFDCAATVSVRVLPPVI